MSRPKPLDLNALVTKAVQANRLAILETLQASFSEMHHRQQTDSLALQGEGLDAEISIQFFTRQGTGEGWGVTKIDLDRIIIAIKKPEGNREMTEYIERMLRAQTDLFLALNNFPGVSVSYPKVTIDLPDFKEQFARTISNHVQQAVIEIAEELAKEAGLTKQTNIEYPLGSARVQLEHGENQYGIADDRGYMCMVYFNEDHEKVTKALQRMIERERGGPGPEATDARDTDPDRGPHLD